MSQLTVMASTAFISRCLERQADEFAINTGYGKDLANALDKMQKFGTYSQIESKCGIICKTVKSIDTALASHPETKDRVQTILSKTETLKALQKMDKGGIARIAMQEMKDYSWQYAAHKHTINE